MVLMDDFPLSGLAIQMLQLEMRTAPRLDGTMPSDEELAAIKEIWFQLRRAMDHHNHLQGDSADNIGKEY